MTRSAATRPPGAGPTGGPPELDVFGCRLNGVQLIEASAGTGKTWAICALVLRLLLQNGEAFVLTPLLLRRTVNLLPTVALMAQLCLGSLLGLPGVLLALPLVVVLQVVCQQVLVRDLMDRWT